MALHRRRCSAPTRHLSDQAIYRRRTRSVLDRQGLDPRQKKSQKIRSSHDQGRSASSAFLARRTCDERLTSTVIFTFSATPIKFSQRVLSFNVWHTLNPTHSAAYPEKQPADPDVSFICQCIIRVENEPALTFLYWLPFAVTWPSSDETPETAAWPWRTTSRPHPRPFLPFP